MNKVKLEIELYEPMRLWLDQYLKDLYKKQKCIIHSLDVHAVTLDTVLEKYNVIKYYPQTVGLDIQIDILGLAIFENRADIFFIEAKKDKLNLHHFGQLWVYCKLCNPTDAFLLSSAGMGSLDKILNHLNRTDLLEFGSKNESKMIKVAKWDVSRNCIDYHTIVPKI